MACGSGEIESWETNTNVFLYCMATILPQGKHHAWFLWASISRTSFTVTYLCQSIWPHQAIHVHQASTSGFLPSPRSQVHSWSSHLVSFPYFAKWNSVSHSFIHSFIHQFKKYTLSTCYVPGGVLCIGNWVWTEQTQTCPHAIHTAEGASIQPWAEYVMRVDTVYDMGTGARERNRAGRWAQWQGTKLPFSIGEGRKGSLTQAGHVHLTVGSRWVPRGCLDAPNGTQGPEVGGCPVNLRNCMQTGALMQQRRLRPEGP